MPTLNEYKNKRGYYINAWTPNTGNITYKIRNEGYAIVEDFEIDHGEEISWDTITSLKSLGLIYTDKSGTIATDEFEPDPEKVAETALSDDEAQELLDIILEHQNLTPDEIDEICGILGIEPPADEFEQLQEQVNEKVEYLIETGIFPSRNTLETRDDEKLLVAINTEDLRETTENGLLSLHVSFIADLPDVEEIPLVRHRIFVCELHGIEDWRVEFNGPKTWEKKGEVSRQMGILMPAVAEMLEHSGIDAGDPEETPAPSLFDLQSDS